MAVRGTMVAERKPRDEEAIGNRQLRRVLVVDSGSLFGAGMTNLLAAAGFEAHRSLVSRLRALSGDWRPGAAVVDGRLGGDMIAEALTALEHSIPGAVVAVVGGPPNAGGSRVHHLPLAADPTVLFALLRGEGTPWPPSVAAAPSATPRNGGRNPVAALTVRERDVLCELMAGRPSAVVAEKLGISHHTVRTHVQNILAKLGVNTRLEAAAVGHRAGLRSSGLGPS